MGYRGIQLTNRFVPMKIILLFIAFAIQIQLFSQNIGIGTSSPVAKFQVNHRSTTLSPGILLLDSTSTSSGIIRFKNISSSPYIEMAGYTGSLTASLHQYLDIRSDSVFIATFRGNGNVGIGTLSPSARLDVVGNVRLSSLAGGTNPRVLRVDASGYLTTSVDTTGVLSIGPKSFTKNSSSVSELFVADEERVYSQVATVVEIGAPVYLPNGAWVTGVHFVFQDRVVSDLELTFFYSLKGGIGIVPLATITTSGADVAIRTFSATLGHRVDNFNNFYSIRVVPAAGSQWEGSLLTVRGVIITYHY